MLKSLERFGLSFIVFWLLMLGWNRGMVGIARDPTATSSCHPFVFASVRLCRFQNWHFVESSFAVSTNSYHCQLASFADVLLQPGMAEREPAKFTCWGAAKRMHSESIACRH